MSMFEIGECCNNLMSNDLRIRNPLHFKLYKGLRGVTD